MTRLAIFLAAFIATLPSAQAAERPNIVVVIADDLGYGDLGCYGAKAIPTPRLDQMASQGLRFTRAYAPASTCTPTRYAMLTGQYAWRVTSRKTTILDGDDPLAIVPGSPTLPEVLRGAGYRTALVGKWHLGMGDGKQPLNFNSEVKPGPLEIGFDSAFYIPATVDRTPCVFIDGHRVAGLDPADPIRVSYKRPVGGPKVGDAGVGPLKYAGDAQHSQAVVNGISRIGYMAGGRSALWTDEEITDVLAERARGVIAADSERPYFLLLGAHDPHAPRAPHARFVGKSKAGRRGDTIVQFDWLVGEVLDAVQRSPQADNTLVIVTSDNGPVVIDGYLDGSDQAAGDHRAAGELRGGKYTAYEGGCRVPTLVHWPARVKPGVSAALVTLTDFLPSLAALAGIEALPAGAAPDGEDLSAALVGDSRTSPRKSVVVQGIGNAYALVTQRWKFLPRNTKRGAAGIGAGASPYDARFAERMIPEDTLYDLAADPGEQRNVVAEHAEVAARLRAQLAGELARTE